MLVPLPIRPLRGATVALRTWQPDDAEWYVSARDEEVLRWTTEPRDLTPDDVRRAIEEQLREPTYAGFAITDAATGMLLGNISLVVAEPDRHTGEVSYWLAAEARGRGAATDAVRTVMRWGFASLPLERIEIFMDPANEASQRVAQRAGCMEDGERGERLVFAMTRDSWSRT
ncbi:MAG: GNAT family N-acetyltransferase [Dehalococcoidia bacterium]